MRTILNCISLAVVLLIASILLCAQECTQLQTSTSEEKLSYLDDVAIHGGELGCIVFAMNSLGLERYEPAIPVLMRFLTFRQAPSKAEQYFPSKNRPEYPVIGPLMRMGEAARPYLLETLKSKETSVTARNNAIYVWMQIHRHDTPRGVAALKDAGNLSTDATAKQNLLSAASSAVKLCPRKDREACETTITEQHNATP